MKKRSVLLVLSLIFAINFVSAVSCSASGTNSQLQVCYNSGSGCTGCSRAAGGDDCLKNGYSTSCFQKSGTTWYRYINTGPCSIPWSCSDIVGGNYCSAGNIYHNIQTASCGGWNGAGNSGTCSWGVANPVLVQTCTYGCSAGVCSSCSPKTCSSSDYLNKCGVGLSDGCESTIDCNICGTGTHCNTSVSGQTGICVSDSSLISAFWANATSPITSSIKYDSVNMVVMGAGLLNQQIDFIIYNSSSNLPIYKSSHVATNDFNDSIPWEANTSGVYYFNATLISVNVPVVKSSNLTVTSSLTATRGCNLSNYGSSIGSINAIWNDNGYSASSGSFDQAWSLVNWRYEPTDFLASYNQTPGVCHFKCLSSNYTWNGTQCNFITQINYCSDITNQTSCNDYSFSKLFAVNEMASKGFSLCSTHTNCLAPDGSEDPDNYSISCDCAWNSSSNICYAAPTYTFINNCSMSCARQGSWLCTFTSSPLINKCNSSLNIMELDSVAQWTGNSSCIPSSCANHVAYYPCPNTAKLPFFDNSGLVLTVLAIILIYLYLMYLRKHRRSKNK